MCKFLTNQYLHKYRWYYLIRHISRMYRTAVGLRYMRNFVPRTATQQVGSRDKHSRNVGAWKYLEW